MKFLLHGTLKISLLLLLTTFVSHAQKAVSYKVTVPEVYISKDYLALATDHIPNRGRYLHDYGFELVLEQENAENNVRSIFEAVGIQVLSISSTKLEVSSLEKAGGNDCDNAELLCSNTSQTANSAGAGTQELNASNQGCMSTEHQSSWYYLNVQTGGTLTMTISPANSSDDYDWAIWGPFTNATAGANCPPVSAPVRCSWSAVTGNTGMVIPYTGQSSSFGCGFLGLFACTGLITTTNNPADNSEGAGGDSWVSNLTTTANQVYILLVDNFSNSGQPYNMSFGGTTVLGCTPVVLPVELSQFSGTSTSWGDELEWVTESETNNDHFDVMHSRDGYTFEKIGTVYGSGTTNQQNRYHFTNQSVVEGTNYYKLSQVNTDGVTTDSKIISIQTETESGIFSMYPNPTKGEIVLQFHSSKEIPATVEIYNQQGILVMTDAIDIKDGMSLVMKDLQNFAAGVYTVVVSTEQNSQQQRVIKID